MKAGGTYRLGCVRISCKVGSLMVKDGRAFVEVAATIKIIGWRCLLWRLAEMFCSTLDIRMPKPQMIELNKTPPGYFWYCFRHFRKPRGRHLCCA